MAEEASAAPPVEAPAVRDVVEPGVTTSSSLSPNQPAVPAPTEAIPADGTNGEASTLPKEEEETAGKQATAEVTAPDGETTEVAQAPPAAEADTAEEASQNSQNKRRKSGGGVPEHKGKKLNKKKSVPSLQLECKPGQMFWAKLKGYPPWPSIICDEQMLPESLLATRPVSTARPDGTIRDDFKEGGKNAKERTFPIMFLSTNEFTWMVNTNLTPLEPDQCIELPKAKMTKALGNAYKIASEDHDLDYFKEILKTWQEEEARIEKELREEEERLAKEAEERAVIEAAEAEKAEAAALQAKKNKKSRKSKGGDDDVDMDDADAPKSAKKRKKDAESDAEGKPKKTPKVTKLNAPKTPNGEASAKKSATKSKKKVVQAPKEEEVVEKEQLTEAQAQERREKAILYLRHRLQKGFLARDQAPQEAEMDAMAEFFSQLEGYENLEPAIIRATKVHKVLKAIVKLSSIPKDEEYNFKKRSAALLDIWNKRMEADGGEVPQSATEPKAPMTLPDASDEKKESEAPETNGESVTDTAKDESEANEGAQKEIEEKAEEAAKELDEKVEEAVVEQEEPPAAVAAPPAEAKDSIDVLKDIEMGEAVPDETAVKEPQTAAEPTTEAA